MEKELFDDLVEIPMMDKQKIKPLKRITPNSPNEVVVPENMIMVVLHPPIKNTTMKAIFSKVTKSINSSMNNLQHKELNLGISTFHKDEKIDFLEGDGSIKLKCPQTIIDAST